MTTDYPPNLKTESNAAGIVRLFTLAQKTNIPISLITPEEIPPQIGRDSRGVFMYRSDDDEKILLLRPEYFNTLEEFCRTLAHELNHAMGTPQEKSSRNDGIQAVAEEEIKAEVGAKMLLEYCEIRSTENDTKHRDYIRIWAGRLLGPPTVDLKKVARERVEKLLAKQGLDTAT